MGEKISIWKAPTAEFVTIQYQSGFLFDHFPGTSGEAPDGKAYFAAQRELAKAYEECYGSGMLEAQLPLAEYVAHFKQFEEPYQDSTLTQIAIPRDMLDHLNRITIRRIWHHG